jgi:hypothetical protein
LELDAGEYLLQRIEVLRDRLGRLGVVLGLDQFEQPGGVTEPVVEPIESLDELLEPRTLAAEFLGPLRIVPDRRLLEFAPDLGQSFVLCIVVKDTPSGQRDGLACP